MLRDVKPPVDFPSNPLFLYSILAVVVVAMAVLIIYFLVKKFRKKQKKMPAPRPPWEIAYERLDELQKENLATQGKIKQYYIRLSDIVRRYIEERFHVNAPEMTSEEFLLSLKEVQWLSVAQKDALKEFLNCCDMVKFAKHASSHKEIEESFALARRLVDETVETNKKLS